MTAAADAGYQHVPHPTPPLDGPGLDERLRLGSGRPRWQSQYVRRLFIGDSLVVAAATALAVVWRGDGSLHGLSYAGIAVAVALAWLGSLYAARAYEPRFLGCGSEEYKRVTNASVHLVAGIAVLALALRLPIARSFVALALVLGTAALVAHRFIARRVLYRARARGRSTHRVVVVGDGDAAASLAASVRREPRAGFHVVGVALTPETALETAAAVGADTIAVTAGAAITPERLRRLAWQLEGQDIDMIVAPALTDVAGPRVSIRPVAGLPLLHVERPEISGARYLFKEMVERALAALILLLMLPLMVAIAIAIKVTTSGPVLFNQVRVSRAGREFSIYKFRSMRVDAEALLETLREQNEIAEGPLFKIRCDPRVTRVGRWLRRYSLDELPQLLNVIRGDMALVGPRPLLPVEVAGFGDKGSRRLLVKPGITGLWQVSGRSDLSWDESVRLDLYYVENWSLALDAQILVRTLRAVLQGAGAY
jgi:exopolysaccharide biosynthesis polyprenyl glycosylphosphotransferase